MQRRPALTFTSGGKLLLFGEHAAVYGHPAVGLGLDSSLTLEIRPSAGTSFPGLSERGRNRLPVNSFRSAGNLLPTITLPPAEYQIQTDIPRSSGFGSSAALCVSLAQYLHTLCEEDAGNLKQLGQGKMFRGDLPGGGLDDGKLDDGRLDDGRLDDGKLDDGRLDDEKRLHRIWQLANSLEALFHGKPSGIDTGLACRRGLHAFFPRPGNLPDLLPIRNSKIRLWIVFGALAREGTTRSLVGRVRQGMLEKQGSIVSAIEGLGEYSRRAIDLLRDE